jgi:hypothetical protein
MSELEVNKISPRSGTDVTLGDSGDTITVASGATLTGDLNADNLTSQVQYQQLEYLVLIQELHRQEL